MTNILSPEQTTSKQRYIIHHDSVELQSWEIIYPSFAKDRIKSNHVISERCLSNQLLGNSCGESFTDFQGKLLYSLMVKKRSFLITKPTLLYCSLSLLLLFLGNPANREWTSLTDQGNGWLGNNFACKVPGDIADSKPNTIQQHTLATKAANSIPCCTNRSSASRLREGNIPLYSSFL